MVQAQLTAKEFVTALLREQAPDCGRPLGLDTIHLFTDPEGYDRIEVSKELYTRVNEGIAARVIKDVEERFYYHGYS